MIRFTVKLLLIAVLFSLCFVATRQITGKWVSFPHVLKEIKQIFVQKQFEELAQEEQPSIVEVVEAIRTRLAENHHVVAGCMAEQGEAVQPKKASQLYRWQDENGRWVFSSAPGDQKNIEAFEVEAQGQDYFNLQVTYPAGPVPTDIKNAIEVKGQGLYGIYQSYLGLDKLSRASIDIYVYGDQAAYEKLRNSNAPYLAANTPGFYSSVDNRAVVLHGGNPSQTQRTAIHETAHVINAQLFGYTPKWFNEGMAEYAENLRMRGQLVEVYPDRYWLGSEELNWGLMPLRQLLTGDDNEWNGERRNHYYGNAWALVYFLMESDNRPLMEKLMRSMSEDRCGLKDLAGFLDAHYEGGLGSLERDWRRWFRNGATNIHRL